MTSSFVAQLSLCVSLAAAISIIREPNKSILDVQRDAALRRCIVHSVTRVSCAGHGVNALVAHPDDCSLFYHCYNQHAVPVCNQCPLTWTFDPVKRACDPLSQHYCAAPPSTSEPGADKETYTQVREMKFPEVTLH